jgi:hypothetical protein
MPEAFSTNREFDFVGLEGLQRMTGRPAHEWDFYILKELIDNALDADEGEWRKQIDRHPRLKVRVEYAAEQLFVEVGNRSIFPVGLIPDIFATKQYTSRKAFIKSMTRGALGNALKTLLGIPYSLRKRVADTWITQQKPLAIICNGIEYLPTYQIDPIAQTIEFACRRETFGRQTEGTIVRVALDYFEQEKPRTFAEIERLAQQYHLANPNVEFEWDVEIGDSKRSIAYAANPQWSSKFRGIAPIRWYSLTAFEDLLGALYREEDRQQTDGELSIESIGSYFAGFDPNAEGRAAAIDNLISEFGRSSIPIAAFEGKGARKLYLSMCDLSLPFDSLQLGRIGKEHIQVALAELLPLDGEVFYEIATDAGDDETIPFIIEAAIAPLQAEEREIWTAINFSPTYGDPFMRRHLSVPIQQDKVIGLRGLLDVYGIDNRTPAVAFVHLICPSLEAGDFSKTDINHLPFKRVIGEVLDRLLRAYDRARAEKELQLEKTIYQALDEILAILKENERFVPAQLLERLRMRLSQEPNLTAWLQAPDVSAQLQIYISNYQLQNAVLTQRFARPAEGIIVLPSHPDRYFSIQAEHLSPDMLTQNHANKILYVLAPELEPVILENGWLCRMDMALLRNPPRQEMLAESLIQCVINSNLPILVLRDGDDRSLTICDRMKSWLRERHLNESRIIDLGAIDDSGEGAIGLMGMMSEELAGWVLKRLQILNIPTKFLPTITDIRQDVSREFDRLLLGYLWEGISQRLKMPSFLNNLDLQVRFTQAMQTQTLDERIQSQLNDANCTQSYRAVADRVLREFFNDFIGQHGSEIQALTRSHLRQLSGDILDD